MSETEELWKSMDERLRGAPSESLDRLDMLDVERADGSRLGLPYQSLKVASLTPSDPFSGSDERLELRFGAHSVAAEGWGLSSLYDLVLGWRLKVLAVTPPEQRGGGAAAVLRVTVEPAGRGAE